ncbi:uncharacterized protein LOC109863898 isoform X2 [Pseudomyrmex gracilis]|uniref:uncharacterized protein LOC109863898 isoform X2 n=1 Tax=Pseudomyrmex gracilis TaxID=219809 RepID=UPI00099533C3|nr:uncharacterized protein LOC109863898 isoform X2 [Pseudomyrmex gracilis]
MGAKRRRLASQCEQNARRREQRSRCTLDALPLEILSIILKMLTLHEVACIVRLVSRRCSDIAATVLNSEFLVAGIRLETAIKRTESLMNSAETDAELLERSEIFNALELVRSQYRMLKAVTWRYTHSRSRGSSSTSCFYGGRVLDNLNCLLRNILNPCSENFSNLLSYDLQIFTLNCENFMDHFEKVTERKMNKSALISGCKIVDVLDCLGEGRQVLSSRILSRTGNPVISMQLRYVLRRAWFTCLKIPNANNEHCWRDKQRYMYLRLRRLVNSFNKHLFHKLHHERNLVHRKRELSSLRKPPPASTYSGYGDYGGQFFYYGNMNKYAYENRFKYPRLVNTEIQTGTELEEESNNRSPRFDLIIGVQLRSTRMRQNVFAGIGAVGSETESED